MVWSINPTLDRSFYGPGVHDGVVFSPNLKFNYDFTPKISGGLEYYGSVGPVTGFNPIAQQQQPIFPVIDLNASPRWEINVGLGVGLTGGTDQAFITTSLGKFSPVFDGAVGGRSSPSARECLVRFPPVYCASGHRSASPY
jgi:hypothetical protein